MLEPLPELARLIFTQALADCSIERSMERVLGAGTDGTSTDAAGTRLTVSGEDVATLDRLKRLRIVAAGKAAAAMVGALLPRLPLPPSCDLQGVLIASVRPPALPPSIQFFPGGHPLPNSASFAGATAALAMLHALADPSPDTDTANTLCIFLLSGGASSMMELPLDPAISLEDTVAFHQALVGSGASIVEINCVRKHFSAVKGGRLAVAAGAASKVSLLVSDVPPAHLDALGSGPTLPDPTTVAQCRKVLADHSLLPRLPASVQRFFASPHLAETPKPGQLVSPAYKLLDAADLAEAARARAAALGLSAFIDNTCDDWDYSAAADYLLDRLRQLRRQHPRVCLISAGEVTVKLPAPNPRAASALGGRNQHLTLYLATQLRPSDGPIAVLSAGSDGIDGNSSAAGAIVDQHTLDRRLAAAQRALQDFNSSSFLTSVGATVVTGPTGHNLRDLRILLTGSGQ
jgi:hydroxypyruvate reductase